MSALCTSVRFSQPENRTGRGEWRGTTARPEGSATTSHATRTETLVHDSSQLIRKRTLVSDTVRPRLKRPISVFWVCDSHRPVTADLRSFQRVGRVTGKHLDSSRIVDNVSRPLRRSRRQLKFHWNLITSNTFDTLKVNVSLADHVPHAHCTCNLMRVVADLLRGLQDSVKCCCCCAH